MTVRRIATLAFVLALGAPVVFVLMTGCDDTPSAPEYGNPFDPLGPDGGDPLQVVAEAINDTSVRLEWNQPQDLGITKYSISTSAFRDSSYSDLAEVEHTEANTNNYFHNDPPPTPTSTIWYRVQAFTNDNFSITSYATPDSANTGPQVIVADGGGTTATRFVNLQITVTEGDQLRIALDPTFTENLVVVPAGAPNEPIELAYDLGTASGNSDVKTLYVMSFADGYESLVSEQDIRIDFSPAFSVVGDPPTLATRLVDLFVPTTGVLNMRFFAEYADTATTPWVAAADTFFGYELSDSANPQFIRGQFQGDLGFSSLVEIQVTPDLLTSASFNLVLPADHVTDQTTVRLASRAVATEMRYAEGADLTAAPWVAYDDTVMITLSPAEGHKVVYVQYRNDWTQSGTLTDYVIHVQQPAEVSFWAPLEGNVVEGGKVFQVRGGSTVGSGAGSVVLVKFDPGDGDGFVDVEGTEEWSYLWDVPRFLEDTPLTLRAQAWYGPSPDSLETVTTAITVTVTQLVVAITAPENDADLTGNKPAVFTGTASGVLNGTPLDKVTVDIGTENFTASGTTNWSLEWTPPLWAFDTTLPVTAIVWAGADTAMTSIQVNVVRPPVAIVVPELDELVDGDIDLPITGVTFADLFTAPVDSVVVDIASEAGAAHLPATGTDSWSAVWRTPVVEANTIAEIIATAHAGAETQADTISVTVKP